MHSVAVYADTGGSGAWLCANRYKTGRAKESERADIQEGAMRFNGFRFDL